MAKRPKRHELKGTAEWRNTAIRMYDKFTESRREIYKSKQWRTMRKMWFDEGNVLCVMCGKPGNVVDHIQSHRGDMRLFWKWSNLQTLCTRCHAIKRQQERIQYYAGSKTASSA